jgi:nitrogen fixation protein
MNNVGNQQIQKVDKISKYMECISIEYSIYKDKWNRQKGIQILLRGDWRLVLHDVNYGSITPTPEEQKDELH